MSRQLGDWLEAYMQFTSKAESPDQFHKWSGLFTLSTAMARRCYLPRGYDQVLPNQYIILIAESAFCRKSSALWKAIDLLPILNVDILKEKFTTNYLYKFLGECAKQEGDGTAPAIIVASELGTLLGKDAIMTGLIATLTSLYDGRAADFRTKTAGTDMVSRPCVNMLGATTLDWMSSSLPGESVEGGFTSRIIFVVGLEPRFRSAWPDVSTRELALQELLMQDLLEISKLRGPFAIDKDAANLYEEWYQTLNEPEDLRLKPFYGRKGDHVLKVAMAISAGCSNSMVIKKSHIDRAMRELEEVEKLMPLAFRGVAFSRSAKDIDRILYMIEKGGGEISHADLLRKNSSHINSKEFKEVIHTLVESNQITAEIKGAKVYYKSLKTKKKQKGEK